MRHILRLFVQTSLRRSSFINSDTPLVDLKKFREGLGLMLCSCSGRKKGSLQLARQARQSGAIIFVLTVESDSPLARSAHHLIFPPVVLEKDVLREPLGSLFEQSLFLYLGGVVLFLMGKTGISEEEVQRRHANLE